MLRFLAPLVVAVLAIIVASSFHPEIRVFLPVLSLSPWNSVNTSTSTSSIKKDDDGATWQWLLAETDSRTHELVVPSSKEGTGTGTRTLTVEQLSSHPPIFRIKNFVTPAECATLRRFAVERGLNDGYVDSDDGLLSSSGNNNNANSDGNAKPKKKMGIFDRNNDGRLSIHELIRMVDDFFESHVSEDDIRAMLHVMGILHILEDDDDDDESVDGEKTQTVSIEDFVRSDTAAMRRFLLQLIQENPSKRSRHSKMAWLTMSMKDTGTGTRRTGTDDHEEKEGIKVLESIQNRVGLLTRLPQHVVHRSMEMQVVHYEPPNTNPHDNVSSGSGSGGGHYTAHFDSLPFSEQPCCHITNGVPPCRPCRMATVLYSLSDNNSVAAGGGGGHTAFPLAEDGRQHTAETVEDWRISAASRESSYCAEDGPGLRIRPELGQAILWYNHDIISHDDGTSSSPLLGELDRSTMHAGCPSTSASTSSGEEQQPKSSVSAELWNAPGKWIANHWIEVSNIPGEDEKHYAKMTGKRNL
jgi:hypothetical protein